MHLRRALLLFAVVLALAALAASISRPVDRERSSTTATAPVPPAAPPQPVREVRFEVGGERRGRRIAPGSRAVVVVEANRPGLVELVELGLSAPVDRLTPARFDVLADRPGCSQVVFTPAGTLAGRAVGALWISEPEPARSGGRRARTTGPDRGRTAARGSAAGRCRRSS